MDLGLKIAANAGAYGIFAEFNRRELPRGKTEEVVLHGHYGAPLRVKVAAPEEPGQFAFPPIAASVTAAARLMLALLERLVRNAGGEYAFCDTDSMAVVATGTGGLIPCPGGPERFADGREAIRALSWSQVDDIRQRFTPLNPYDPGAVPGSILNLEDENFDPATGDRRQLWCFTISAKRYALFNWNENSTLTLCGKPSEHGLGHLLNPVDPDNPDRNWIRTLWEGILTEEVLRKPYPWPAWLTRPAVGRITVSSPTLLRLFDGINRRRPYPDQIKPFNFLLTAFVRAFGHPDGADPDRFHLVAPWNPDSRQWLKVVWFDRDSGQRFHITTSGHTGAEGMARVKTYGNVLAEYQVHPELKSLGPDGRPCDRRTQGLLGRRPVTATHITYVGKESNKLEDVEAGLIHDPDEVLTEYPDPRRDQWKTLILPVLKEIPARIAVEAAVNERTFKRVKAGGSYPNPKNRTALFRVAAQWARAVLCERGVSPPTDDLACCAAYLEERKLREIRTCLACRAPLRQTRARYCGQACKQRARRRPLGALGSRTHLPQKRGYH